MPDSKVYPIPDPVAIAMKVKASGGPALDPSQPSGQASADGVTLSWVIEAGNITITLLKKPFFVPESTVWSHVDQLFTD